MKVRSKGRARVKESVRDVAQASSPASFGTVPVLGLGGETPPELAAETVALQGTSDPLINGFHFRGVLPHLKKEGGTYFVAFRQAGSLPREVVIRLKQEREAVIQQAMAAKRPLTWHEQEELFRWYSNRVDSYLDAGHGVCHLRDKSAADVVAGAIQFFQGKHFELRA